MACESCGEDFTVLDSEVQFLEKMGLPCPPRRCPACRRQRRLAFRNERRLYHRECDDSGKKVIALYPQDSKQKIVMYEQSAWWDYEKMDPLAFGQDYDFSRPFFDQFYELKTKVPHPNLHNTNVQNAMYGNHCVSNKNCYLTIGSDLCEECYYTYWAIRCNYCYDCSVAYDSELCHSCLDIRLCYNCFYVENCENMIDCQYCFDCKSCNDCFGCVGLRHKEYHFLNEKLTEDEYKLRLQKVQTDSAVRENVLHRYEVLRRSFNHLATKNIQCEDVVGDRLWRSRKCYYSFDLEKCEDVNLSTYGFEGITSQDVDFFGRIEKLYESFSAFGQNNCISTILCHYSFDTFYSEYCISCHHLVGCCALHHNNYCILNKSYTRAEYEKLFPKIIDHMKETGEWGEFFPARHSPFPYNVTVAQRYYPLSKDDIESKGWVYEEPDKETKRHPVEHDNSFVEPPGELDKADPSICKEVLRCERTNRPFQIQPKEYDYLALRELPIPRCHQDERNAMRMARKNLPFLWESECEKCSELVRSSYEPAKGFRVLCEGCYGVEAY